MATSIKNGTFISKADPDFPTRSKESLRQILDNNDLAAYANQGELGILADRVFDEPTRLYNLDVGVVNSIKVIRIAKEMIQSGEMGYLMNIRSAIDGAFQLVPEYPKYFQSAKWVVEEALAAGLQPDAITAENLVPFLHGLGKTGKIGLSAYGRDQESKRQADQWEATERARLVASILQGKDSFQIYGKVPGESSYLRTFPASSLDDPAVTLEKLRELDAAAADVRRKQGQTRDERADELRQRATEARGHEIFRQGDKTELDVQVGYKDSGDGYQVVGEGPHSKPSAGSKMDRSVLTSSVDRSVFVSPDTNKFFTKKEICQIANHNPALFRRLRLTDARFLNDLLAQAN